MNWFKQLFSRRRLYDDLSEEIHEHLEEKIGELVASGMPRKEAAAAARREFGNVTLMEEDSRRVWRWPSIEDFFMDVRYGVRMLRKNPGFTAVAVLTLALGIGANTAVFGVVNAVLLRPLPFKQPSRLMMLFEGIPKLGFPKMGFSAPDLAVFERAQKSFESIGVYQNKYFNISGDKEPERLMSARISSSVFPMLGAEPMLGRTFTIGEDAPGQNVVILSYGLWQRRFGADPGIIGRNLELNRQPYTVIGVMPKAFNFPLRGPQGSEPAELWVPMAFTATELEGWGTNYMNAVLARLRPGLAFEQASAEAASLSRSIGSNYPPELTKAFQGAELKVGMNSYHEEVVKSVRTLLLILMAAVVLVLLIACANVATLLISRAASRQKEVALRTTLGATRVRLLRQMLTESLLLALIGGSLGLAFAFWVKTLLLSLVPESVPLPRDIPIGGSVIVFVLAASFLTTVLFGLVPAFQVSAMALHGQLQETGRSGTPGRLRLRLQSFFVTVEFALALVLLIGSGLLIRSFAKLLETNPGFRPDHVLTLNIPIPSERYTQATKVRQFYERLLDRAGNIPGVRAVGLTSDLPLNGCGTIAIQIEGGRNAGGETPQAICQTWQVGNFFQTLGIPLRRGRSFTLEDRIDAQPVAIVSETAGRQFWPGQDPIGKRIRWGVYTPWQTVVGIVGDVNDGPLGQPVQLHVYRPYLQMADLFFEDSRFGEVRSMNLALLSQTDPASLTSAVIGQIHSLDPDLAVAHIRTMAQVISSSVAGPRFNTLLLGVFAGVALFLAAIGIYGVMAYAITQQTHEIGIRLALGAQPRNVLQLVLRRGMRLAGVGAAFGVAAALALTRLMAGLLYDVSANDPLTFSCVVILLLAIALLACYVPARRAMRVDPMVALRYE
ncbi:MAG TPA: ABC transporter permease [Candidatus Acidoferrum sp.]